MEGVWRPAKKVYLDDIQETVGLQHIPFAASLESRRSGVSRLWMRRCEGTPTHLACRTLVRWRACEVTDGRSSSRDTWEHALNPGRKLFETIAVLPNRPPLREEMASSSHGSTMSQAGCLGGLVVDLTTRSWTQASPNENEVNRIID